jgi:hypothetical protein
LLRKFTAHRSSVPAWGPAVCRCNAIPAIPANDANDANSSISALLRLACQ